MQTANQPCDQKTKMHWKKNNGKVHLANLAKLAKYTCKVGLASGF